MYFNMVTEAILSTMSRRVPTQRDVLGFTKVTNDKQSRFSRGWKSIAGGKTAEGQKSKGFEAE